MISVIVKNRGVKNEGTLVYSYIVATHLRLVFIEWNNFAVLENKNNCPMKSKYPKIA